MLSLALRRLLPCRSLASFPAHLHCRHTRLVSSLTSFLWSFGFLTRSLASLAVPSHAFLCFRTSFPYFFISFPAPLSSSPLALVSFTPSFPSPFLPSFPWSFVSSPHRLASFTAHSGPFPASKHPFSSLLLPCLLLYHFISFPGPLPLSLSPSLPLRLSWAFFFFFFAAPKL